MNKLILAAVALLITTAAVKAEDAAEVTIGSTDQMQYTKTSFEVKAGQMVKLTLKHEGKMPKAAMGHNLVILAKGVAAMSFGAAVMPNGGSVANDYIPTKNADQMIAHTKMIGGGESVTIEFTAPAEAGNYEYLCTFPGHFALMKGVMTVK
jgi:azurin